MRRTGAIAFCVVCSAPIAQAQSLTADESEEIPSKEALQTLVSEAPDHPRSVMASVTAILFCIGIVVCAHEAFLKRKVSERFIVQIALPLWAFSPFQVSPDGRHAANVGKLGKKVFAVVDGKEGKRYDRMMGRTPIFSSDSKRVACVAILGFTISSKDMPGVCAEEGKEWFVSLKQFVVVDGKEGKEYTDILGKKGGKTLFLTPAPIFVTLLEKDRTFIQWKRT